MNIIMVQIIPSKMLEYSIFWTQLFNAYWVTINSDQLSFGSSLMITMQIILIENLYTLKLHFSCVGGASRALV